MKKMIFLLGMFFLLIPSVMAIDVSQCQELNSAGATYDLTTNFTNTTAVCFPITAENITLDCHGYVVIRSVANTKFVNASVDNITVKNCIINSCEYGMWGEPTATNFLIQNNTINCSTGHVYVYGENNTIRQNIFYKDATYGVTLRDISSGTVYNNTFRGTMDYALLAWNANSTNITFNRFEELTAGAYTAVVYLYDAYDNVIYNNLFNATTYIELGASEGNYWNVTKRYGTRIYGTGTVLGGNYYTNHSGDAFSDTCTDTDQDGLCDSAYTVGTNNVDNLPMSLNFTNHAPTTTASRLYSSTNTTAVPLQGFCTGTDPDYEPLRYYCSWYLNGTLNSTNCSANTFTQGIEANPGNLSGSNLFGGNWSLGCIAYDGTVNGTQINSSNLTISEAPAADNPTVTSLSTNSPQGYGYNISINATVSDSDGIDTVLVEITYPNSTAINYTMENITATIYNYLLTSLWDRGTYNFTIIANDTNGDVNGTESDSFIIGISATMGVYTISDNYGLNQEVNLTDPPAAVQYLDLGLSIRPISRNTDEFTDVIVYFKNEPMVTYTKTAREEAERDLFRIIVGFFSGEEKSISDFVENRMIARNQKIKNYEGLMEDEGLVIEKKWDYAVSGVSGTIPTEKIKDIEDLDFVQGVWEDTNLNILLNDSIPLINADDVWEEQNGTGDNITGLGIRVAVIDSGIDYTHPFFGSCTLENVTSGNCKKIEYMYDFYNDDSDAYDDHYHGTHCAGIVSGVDPSGKYNGVAPNVTLVIYKVCSSGGSCPSSDIISAVNNASAYGVDIMSMSLGGRGNVDDTNPLYIAMKNAYDAGVLEVVAAGNSGSGPDSMEYPGGIPFVVSVGATKKDDSIAAFSSRGFAKWSNATVAAIKPDLTAPGYAIVSAYPVRFGATNNVTSLSGTSMATPHVAGVAALTMQAHPDWNISQVRSALAHGTKGLSSSYTPNDVGTGRTDALKTYNMNEVVIRHNQFMGENTNNVGTYWESVKNFSITNLNTISTNYTLSISTSDSNYNYTLNVSSMVIDPGETGYFSLNVSTNNSNQRFQNTWAEIQLDPNTTVTTYDVPVGMKDSINPPGCLGAPYYINNATTIENLSCIYAVAQGYSVFVVNSSNASLTCINTSVGGVWYGSAIMGDNLDNVTVRGCDFYNFYTPFSFHNSRNMWIFNNTIRNSYTFGVFGVIDDISWSEENDIEGVDNLYIYNNTFYGATSTQSILWDTGLIIRQSDNVTIDNNIFNYSGSRGLMIYGPIYNLSVGDYVSNYVNLNATISNNVFDNTTYPIDVANFQGTRIINNTLEYNNYLVLLRESNENYVENISIVGNTSDYSPGWANGLDFGRTTPWAEYFPTEPSVNETVKKANISVVYYAFVIQESENLEIQDSTITCSGTDPEYPCIGFQDAAGNTSVIMVNTTYNESDMKWDYSGSSSNHINVTTKWWSDITVKDGDGTGLSGSSVVIYENSTGTWKTVHSGTTDSNGILEDAKIPQKLFIINETDRTTSYYYVNITASKAGYTSNSTVVFNLSTNTNYELTLQDFKSMIDNIGSTDFMGYLTLKVQKNVSDVWSDHDVVTNNILYNVTSESNLALDIIWYGDGAYTTNETGKFRVFAEFKDPSGDVLQTDSLTYLNSTYNFNVTADTTAPTISGVSASAGSSSATISWTTDENANSSLVISPPGTYSNSSDYNTSHSIAVSGLTASTTYYYNVTSCDESGNCNTSTGHSFDTSAVSVSPGGGGAPPGDKSVSITTKSVTVQVLPGTCEIIETTVRSESGAWFHFTPYINAKVSIWNKNRWENETDKYLYTGDNIIKLKICVGDVVGQTVTKTNTIKGSIEIKQLDVDNIDYIEIIIQTGEEMLPDEAEPTEKDKKPPIIEIPEDFTLILIGIAVLCLIAGGVWWLKDNWNKDVFK